MTVASPPTCSQCARPRGEQETWCALCGEPFEGRAPRASASAEAWTSNAATAPGQKPDQKADEEETQARVLGLPEPWFFLLVGALTAPVFALTPILSFLGWFVSALAHEMGHAAVAWFFGMPAYPAIRLDGHAAAFHQDQKPLVVACVVLALVGLAWTARTPKKRALVGAGMVAVYLALALTPARELFHLLAGHGGELVIAAIFLTRAFTGGVTSSSAERGLYGTLGWFLLGSNVILSAGLVVSEAARSKYAHNGSFGFKNDYLRLADDLLGVPLPLVAATMTLVALGVLTSVFAFVAKTRSEVPTG